MQLRQLALTSFRNLQTVELTLPEGLTAVIGDNGQGKTNLLESIAFMALSESFRGAPPEALVAYDADRAVVRAVVAEDERVRSVDAEIPRQGRVRIQVNGRRLGRSRDLLGVLRVTVFSPDDLALVKGGPAGRRTLLDELLVGLAPANDALRMEVERILKQRGSLLRQAGGRRTAEIDASLDVWDVRLAEAGERLADARSHLVDALAPVVAKAYASLAPGGGDVAIRYVAPWREQGLLAALTAGRLDDLRRGTNGIGPHRDDLAVELSGASARIHASQGEQRTLALALRLGGHRLLDERLGTPPLLLLDDVFSELDPWRSAALLRALPAGQAVLTTAAELPADAAPQQVLHVRAGTIR